MRIEDIFRNGPKFEPLFNDLKALNIDEFLESRNFKNFCIKNSFEDKWNLYFDLARANNRIIAVNFDFTPMYRENAFVFLMNNFYSNNISAFFIFIKLFLYEYKQWEGEYIDLDNIIEDLEIIGCPKEIISAISTINNGSEKLTISITLPRTIENAQKLEESIQQMDLSIKDARYNLTMTYAYSCLEGLFKAYTLKLIPSKSNIDKLNQLAKIVRDDIIDSFKEKGIDYPEQIINLITTMTNAISNARNEFSDSHFDKNADKWLAQFARDSVYSIGRLILNLM